jgi:hypothetical protein
LAKRIADEEIVLVCDDCAMQPIRLGVILEALADARANAEPAGDAEGVSA